MIRVRYLNPSYWGGSVRHEKPVSFIRLKKSRSAEPMYGAKNQEAAKPLSFFIVNGTYAQTSSCNARGRDAKL
jgi:hypothetical protein